MHIILTEINSNFYMVNFNNLSYPDIKNIRVNKALRSFSHAITVLKCLNIDLYE